MSEDLKERVYYLENGYAQTTGREAEFIVVGPDVYAEMAFKYPECFRKELNGKPYFMGLCIIRVYEVGMLKVGELID